MRRSPRSGGSSLPEEEKDRTVQVLIWEAADDFLLDFNGGRGPEDTVRCKLAMDFSAATTAANAE